MPVHYSWPKVVGAWGLELLGAMFRPLLARHPSRTRKGRPRRVLIVEPFGLGDLVCATAMIRPLRERFPGVVIGVACHRRWAPFLERHPGIDRVHSHEFPWSGGVKRIDWAAARRLFAYCLTVRRESYDIGFDIRGDIRSQLVLLAAGCVERFGFLDYMGSNIAGRGYLLTRGTRCGVQPRLDELRGLLETADVPVSSPLHIELPAVERSPQARTRPRIGVHVGAGWLHRKWPLAKWQQLLVRLGAEVSCEIVLIGAPADRSELEQIQSQLTTESVVEITDTVLALLEAIGALDALVCLDSAPLHIAVGYSVPTVVLFGPGEVSRWSHADSAVTAIHHQERFSCAPCTQLSCIFPESNCVDAIEVGEVRNAILQTVGALR